MDPAARVSDLELEVARLSREKRDLEATLAAARTSSVALLATCEEAQEGISNRLLREIDRLRAAQAAMCAAVEAEERQLVGVLQKRMDVLQHEKVDLENALEQEQERIVNRLTRQMDDLRRSLAPRSADSPPGAGAGSLPPVLPDVAHPPAHPTEREAELQRTVARLLAENQALVLENVQLKNRLRRQSVDSAASINGNASAGRSSPPPPAQPEHVRRLSAASLSAIDERLRH